MNACNHGGTLMDHVQYTSVPPIRIIMIHLFLESKTANYSLFMGGVLGDPPHFLWDFGS